MKKTIAVALLAAVPVFGFAAGGVPTLPANVDLGDRASLQRGARLFVNYCLSCHSASFMRYKRMGADLRLSDDQVRENLMFASEKIGDRMQVAMRAEQGTSWFGVAPPDLSVIARARGSDWLYSYLVTFFKDANPSRPFGVNNLVFQDVGMPHALWSLQGIQEYTRGELPGSAKAASEHIERIEASGDAIKIHKSVVTESGEHLHVTDSLDVTTPGIMQPGEYRKAVRDLVSFLTYVGEPAKLVRYQIGFWVLVFLIVFFFLTRRLYKEYWRDVH